MNELPALAAEDLNSPSCTGLEDVFRFKSPVCLLLRDVSKNIFYFHFIENILTDRHWFQYGQKNLNLLLKVFVVRAFKIRGTLYMQEADIVTFRSRNLPPCPVFMQKSPACMPMGQTVLYIAVPLCINYAI